MVCRGTTSIHLGVKQGIQLSWFVHNFGLLIQKKSPNGGVRVDVLHKTLTHKKFATMKVIPHSLRP